MGEILVRCSLRCSNKLAPGEHLSATGTGRGPAPAPQPAGGSSSFGGKGDIFSRGISFPPGKNILWAADVVLLGPTSLRFEMLSFSSKYFCFNGSGEEIVYLPTEGFRKHDLITVEHFIFFLLQAMGNW